MKFFRKPINMKSKIILSLSWICVVLTMAMIFFFSSEDSKKSTQTSTDVIEDVLDIVLPKDEITPTVVEKFQFPFRKAAHFGIYMLLGFCLANAFQNTIRNKWYISYPCALVTSILYAISDEWHQNFSDGRGPSFKDTLIDSSGALVGILVFLAFVSLYLHFKNSKKPIKK